MKKSDIIDLALKIFGIYVVILSFLNLKDLHYFKTIFSQNDPFSTDILSVVIFFSGGIITFLIGSILIFRSTKIARKICKEDFDINLAIDLNYSKVLEIALIIIGLFILIFQFGNLLSSFSHLLSQITSNFPLNNQSISFIIASILQYLLGYILLTNAKALAAWIIRINLKNMDELKK